MIAADPRPMSLAPVDGTPVRLLLAVGLSLRRFGARNAPKGHSGLDIIVRASIWSTMMQPKLTAQSDGSH
jgi:hypothetical protein